MSQDIHFHYQTSTSNDTLLAVAARLQLANYEKSNIWKHDSWSYFIQSRVHTAVITPPVKYANLMTHNSD